MSENNMQDVGRARDVGFKAPTNFIYFPYKNSEFLTHIDPLEADKMRASITRTRQRLITEIPHNESRINNDRIGGFLAKYGLPFKPYIAVDQDGARLFEKILAEEEGFEITQEYLQSRQEAHGSYSPLYDAMFVIRNPEIEQFLGMGHTEADVVHEETHASGPIKDLIVYPQIEDKRNYVGLRNGFVVEDEGWFWEEGFAGIMRDKYIVEEVKLPDGFSGRTVPIQVNISGIDLTLPARCITFQEDFEMDSSAIAAYGVQLLAAKDPHIVPAMIRSRSQTRDGLREFSRRVDAFDRGLYSQLRRLPDSPAAYLYGTKKIIERLYSGNQIAALKAADSALGVKRV